MSGPQPRVRLPRHVEPVSASAVRGTIDTTPGSMADVIERLYVAFEQELSLPTIVAVVRRCRRELDIVSGPPLPEMLERLARQRLRDLSTLRPTSEDGALADPR